MTSSRWRTELVHDEVIFELSTTVDAALHDADVAFSAHVCIASASSFRSSVVSDVTCLVTGSSRFFSTLGTQNWFWSDLPSSIVWSAPTSQPFLCLSLIGSSCSSFSMTSLLCCCCCFSFESRFRFRGLSVFRREFLRSILQQDLSDSSSIGNDVTFDKFTWAHDDVTVGKGASSCVADVIVMVVGGVNDL